MRYMIHIHLVTGYSCNMSGGRNVCKIHLCNLFFGFQTFSSHPKTILLQKGMVLITGLPESNWSESDIVKLIQPFGTPSDIILASQIGKVSVKTQCLRPYSLILNPQPNSLFIHYLPLYSFGYCRSRWMNGKFVLFSFFLSFLFVF